MGRAGQFDAAARRGRWRRVRDQPHVYRLSRHFPEMENLLLLLLLLLLLYYIYLYYYNYYLLFI